MNIQVMPNIDKFLDSVDIFADELEVIDGVKYVKYWYYDNNGLYRFVYDHA